MSKLISVSIDVNKIDKSLLKEVVLKSGNKAKFLNITVSVNDTPDQYGKDVQVWHEQTKEERDAKADRKFLGNGKVVFISGAQAAPAATPTPVAKNTSTEDDLPF